MFSQIFSVLIFTALAAIISFAIFVGGWKAYTAYRNFMVSDQELINTWSVIDPAIKVAYITSGDTQLRYAVLGPKDAQPLVLIHGAPGSIFTRNSLIMETTIAQKYRLYVVDRPGYGHSTNHAPLINFDEQSRYIGRLFDDTIITRNDALVVGYSFGSSILPHLMNEYASYIAGALFVGGSTDPDQQIIRRVNHLSRFSLFRSFMPDSLNRTNHESLASEDQLRKIADSWQTITIPSVILHSFDDSIVPYENAIYTDQHLKNAPHIVIRDDDINHFYPYKAPGRIVEALETLHQLTSLST